MRVMHFECIFVWVDALKCFDIVPYLPFVFLRMFWNQGEWLRKQKIVRCNDMIANQVWRFGQGKFVLCRVWVYVFIQIQMVSAEGNFLDLSGFGFFKNSGFDPKDLLRLGPG